MLLNEKRRKDDIGLKPARLFIPVFREKQKRIKEKTLFGFHQLCLVFFAATNFGCGLLAFRVGAGQSH